MESWSTPACKPSQGTTIAYNADLLTRTSWVDAQIALIQIKKGKANGNILALRLRAKVQNYLFSLGCLIQQHAGKVLFVCLLLLSMLAVGLKSAKILTDVQKLWVVEGGRLEKELNYIKSTIGEGSGSSNEILIQTPRYESSNILTLESLQAHLQAALLVTKIEIEVFDVLWSFKDLCFSPTAPSFDNHMMDSILSNIFPCTVITPLDCFWEGAKLLGPTTPIYVPGHTYDIRWTNLNPKQLLASMQHLGFLYPNLMSTLDDFMQRAGITTAYQEKPCLNPYDPECPTTAPNKQSGQSPDLGAVLTGGCYGFATKFMHWSEELIIGGIQKNKTGHIVKAEALQTVFQLMGEKIMFDYYADTYKVHSIDWSQDKARTVLELWQRKFRDEMLQNKNGTKSYNINAFSSTTLSDILAEFSKLSTTRVVVGYLLMLVYAAISLMRCDNFVQSQSILGVAGVILVTLAVMAGLGFCAFIQLGFNASTTQLVPFLALGLGVDHMFLIAHTYAENANNNVPHMDQIGEILKRTGISILLTSVCNSFAFFTAAMIPIPALRAFSLQAAILVIFNMASMLLAFPAIITLDLRRREAQRYDFLCCIVSSESQGVLPPTRSNSKISPQTEIPKRQTVTKALPPDGQQAVTILVKEDCWTCPTSLNTTSPDPLSPPSSSSTRQLLTSDEESGCINHRKCVQWSLSRFAKEIYAPLLQRTPVKVCVVIGFMVLLGSSVWGMVQVSDGLDLTDVVPRHTSEYKFLEAQKKYFGFFNMFAVTQGDFDYPNNQKLLYDYHEAFQRINKIIKNDDGGLPEFWLSIFRDWLIGLQDAFDKNWRKGCISQDRWYENATEEGILAYKLLAQTGKIDNPWDKTQVFNTKLIDSDGIINPKAFYNYLSAWVANDALAFTASQANLHPEPKHWVHDPNDSEMKIPKSQPLVYAQMPFYLNNMADTKDITSVVEAIRSICQKFTEKGLPNFPTGVPFIFWEQYLNLRFFLMIALVCILITIFVVLSVFLMNPWVGAMVVTVLAMMVVELFGFMGITGIKLSAVPAVILIVAVGMGVEFTLHICMGFITSIGNKNLRMEMALQHMMSPVFHGAISTLLGVMMLAFSEFDFILRYFFYVLTALVLIGLLNGLVILPVLLSIVGPLAEVMPKDNSNSIPPPTPPSPARRRSIPLRSISRRMYPRINSEISLTTITEEPSWQSSHEIHIEPEVIVETTIHPQVTASSDTPDYTPPSNRSSVPCHRTTVTAKVKVEVHTTLPGAVGESFKHKRRRTSDNDIKITEVDIDSDTK